MKRLVSFAAVALSLSACSGRGAQDRRIAHLKAQTRLGLNKPGLTCMEKAEREHKLCLEMARRDRASGGNAVAYALGDSTQRASTLARVDAEQSRSDATCHAELQAKAIACNGPAQATAPKENDAVSKLERLAALREKGLLTEQEFVAQKAQLLGSSAAPAAAAPEVPAQATTPTP